MKSSNGWSSRTNQRKWKASGYWVFDGAKRPIGYCGLSIGRGSFDEPELAYEILLQFRGHGYATEAAGAVIDAAFHETGRDRLWATVGIWNAPSFRVLEKLGFEAHHSSTDERGEFVWMVRTAPASMQTGLLPFAGLMADLNQEY